MNMSNIVDVDECSSQPCQNNGRCLNGIAQYSCRCIEGYAGTNCEQSMYANMDPYAVNCLSQEVIF